MRKKNLLIVTNQIPEYRIPVYNNLSEYFEVTIAHYGQKTNKEKIKFTELQLTKKSIGSFIYFKENIKKISEKFDGVIALGDLHVIPYIRLGLLKNRKFALTYWSIGVSASYDKEYDSDKKFSKIRQLLLNNADSIVFYTDYPIKLYVSGGVDKNKLFVANNTVEVTERISISKVKKHFLFVGTLYKAKKIFDLLEAYKVAYKKNNLISPLIIIGDGEEYTNIINWIESNNLHKNITLTGAIYDQERLKTYYKDAIACLSPGQAGLTILNSMAYGVPFVTTENAITGGEIFNISNNVNGIIYKEDIENLSEIIHDLSFNNDKVYNLSLNAQEYYFSNRIIDIMVDGLKDAINFAIEKNIDKQTV